MSPLTLKLKPLELEQIRYRLAVEEPRVIRRANILTTLWGRLTEIPYSSITGVKAGSIQGLPILMVASSELKSPLYIYTLGLDRDTVHSHLYTLVGADNPLTRAFSPSPEFGHE